MKARALVVAIVTVVAVAGCSTTGSQGQTEAKQASLSDWTEWANQIVTDLDLYIASWRQNSCEVKDIEDGNAYCQEQLRGLYQWAESEMQRVKEETDPTNPDYIGVPPDEISNQVTQAGASATALSAAAGAADAACPSLPNCGTAANTFLNAWRDTTAGLRKLSTGG